MTQFLDSDVAKFAVAAVREASILVRRVQAEMVGEAITKGDKSPVTVADFAAQAIVARRLAERFPDAVLVGEESSGALQGEESRATLEQITRFVQSVEPAATAEDGLRVDRPRLERSGRRPSGRSTRSTGRRGFCGRTSTRSRWRWWRMARSCSASSGAPNWKRGFAPPRGERAPYSWLGAAKGHGCNRWPSRTASGPG